MIVLFQIDNVKKLLLLILFINLNVFVFAQTKDIKTKNDTGKLVSNTQEDKIFIDISVGAAFPTIPNNTISYYPSWFLNVGVHFEITGNYIYSSDMGLFALIGTSVNRMNTHAANSLNYSNLEYFYPPPPNYDFMEYFFGVTTTARINSHINLQFITAIGILTMDAPSYSIGYASITPIIHGYNPVSYTTTDSFYGGFFGVHIGINAKYKLNKKIDLLLELPFTYAYIPDHNNNYIKGANFFFGLIEPSIGISYKF